MKRYRIAVAATVAFCLLLSACGSGDKASFASVVHLSADTPALDVAIDGGAVFAGLGFGTATGYFGVPSGDRQVELRLASNAAAVLQRRVYFKENFTYSLFAVGALDSIDLVVAEDDLTLPGPQKARLRAVHAAPQAPALDVYLTSPEADLATQQPLVADLSFKEVSPYQTFPTGEYRIRMTRAGTTEVVVDTGTIALTANAIRTVAVVEQPGGGPPLAPLLLADAR